ncbi:MAG: M48 family metalloprotease [Desulfobacteraceae bacterium]|nr:M48 family metalloprotease [Desulfobacteraceae bacterium]
MKKIKLVMTAVFIFTLMFPINGYAISIKEEKELSQEMMKYINARYQLIKDPAIVKYVNELGEKILAHMPPQPFPYRFYVIKEDVYNAFATPAGQIFINSGLFEALDSEEELAGIMAHEIAHAAFRHISQNIERAKKINMATMAGMLAGLFLGTGGSTTAGNAVALGSVAAGQSMALAYTRENEMQADQVGLQILQKTGYSGKGLLTSLQKIRSKQWFGSKQIPTYLLTHPASEDRIAYVDSWISSHERQGTTSSAPSDTSMAFRRAHTRLVGIYSNQNRAVSTFEAALRVNADDPIAHYGYALVLERTHDYAKAESHIKKALQKNALDPFFLQTLGSIFFHQGRYADAVATLESAVSLTGDDPDAYFMLGRAQAELGDLNAAGQAFEKLISVDPSYAKAYYFLGETRGKTGDLTDAHYYLGLYYDKTGDSKNAAFHLRKVLAETTDPQRREEIEYLIGKNSKLQKEKEAAAKKDK